MQYTKIPVDTFNKLQINAGILLDSFTPASATAGNLIAATTGGISMQDNVTYTDFGDDIDNCPKNTKELKKLESHEFTMSGTYVTLSDALAKSLVGAADSTTTSGVTKITPRNDLKITDFDDFWWVGDYSDQNTGASAGFVAVHIMNALNTGGFNFSSGDKAKGQFPFTYTAHYSIDAQDTVPYEIYIKAGTGATGATGATGT